MARLTGNAAPGSGRGVPETVFPIIAAISFAHLLNDLLQALLPAIYPMLKDQHGLSFVQVGLLTLTFQFSASLLQPVVGIAADRRPLPYSMAVGMGSTLVGLLLLARADQFPRSEEHTSELQSRGHL